MKSDNTETSRKQTSAGHLISFFLSLACVLYFMSPSTHRKAKTGTRFSIEDCRHLRQRLMVDLFLYDKALDPEDYRANRRVLAEIDEEIQAVQRWGGNYSKAAICHYLGSKVYRPLPNSEALEEVDCAVHGPLSRKRFEAWLNEQGFGDSFLRKRREYRE